MATVGYCSNYVHCGTAAGKRVVELKANREHCPDCGMALHPIADMEPLLVGAGGARNGAAELPAAVTATTAVPAAAAPRTLRTEHFSDDAPSDPFATVPEPAAPPREPFRIRQLGHPARALSIAAAVVLGLVLAGGATWAIAARSAVPIALRICGSNIVGGGLGFDLLQGFYSSQGGSKIEVTPFDATGQATVGADVGGNASRIAIRADGSAAAYAQIANGTCQTAIVDRPPTPDELANIHNRYAGAPDNFTRSLALDGVAIVVNPSNAVGRLTLAQVRGIFSGELRTWPQVGGSGGNILVMAPPDSSDVANVLSTRVLGGEPITGSARRVGSQRELSAGVAHDRDAIGVVPFSDSSPAKAIALAKSGTYVAPSVLSLGTAYPLTLRLGLYAPERGDNALSGKLTDYLASNDAKNIIGNAGLVPAGP
jgi:ABC-type phosphate transport system substrate-binding protein